MIQRVQSIYYGLAIVCMIIVSCGVNVFSFAVADEHTNSLTIDFSAHAVLTSANLENVDFNAPDLDDLKTMMEINDDEKVFKDKKFASGPTATINAFSWVLLLLVALCTFLTVITLLSFKKLKKQLKIGRLAFFLSLIVLILLMVVYYVGGSAFEDMIPTAEGKSLLGTGFFLLTISVAFIFLGNLGVRKDAKLISSLDRLR